MLLSTGLSLLWAVGPSLGAASLKECMYPPGFIYPVPQAMNTYLHIAANNAACLSVELKTSHARYMPRNGILGNRR